MRRGDPFDRRAMALSVVLHAAVIAVALLSSIRQEPAIEFLTYEVDLVSPPPAIEAEEYTPPREELVVERPEPAPPEPEPEPEPVAAAPPQPAPAPPTPAPTPPEPLANPSPAAGPNADPNVDPARSGEGINVRMEGLRRDYPQYYNNIIRQIQRCFRQPPGNWSSTVTFVIRRDGSVDDLEVVRRSGNPAFDYAAMGAVECAGQGRFGPLPSEMPYDNQPIQFDFRPSGGGQ